MSIYNWILIACWAVFMGYWLISAGTVKRNIGVSSVWRGTWIRIAFVAIVILIVHFTGLHVDYTTFYGHDASMGPVFSIVGVVFAVCGIGFAVWARSHLGRNWGMPMTIKEKPELVTSGPYALVRHPIYTGVLLAILGSMLVVGFWWLLIFVAAAAYFIYSATREEALMLKEFPDQYPAYKARTKMLIPYLW